MMDVNQRPQAGPSDSEGTPWVLFDAVGTVLSLRRSVAEVYHEAAIRSGLSVSQSTIRQRFPLAFEQFFCGWQTALPADWMACAAAWRTGSAAAPQDFVTGDLFSHFFQLPVDEAVEKQRWRDLVAQVLVDEHDPDGQAKRELAFTELWELFAQPETWCVAPETTAAIVRLKAAGKKVGLASNFDQRLLGIAAGLANELPVDRIFFSAQLGYRKPDPRFYREILRRLRVAPEQVVMVGDRWWEDFAAPTMCGISSYYYAPKSPAERGAGTVDHHPSGRRLTDLAQLPL